MGAVQPLEDGHKQLNERFPKRDKASDGLWGNKAHQQTKSSHNGDKSGNAEWKDGDSKDEVRARDWDKDLKDAETGTTMEHVVQEWVRLARNGKMWWLRYIIFNGRIWHQNDGFKTRKYNGKNKHDKHVHVNTDFSQKVDDLKNTDWGLKNFRRKSATKPKPPTKPTESATVMLDDDGQLGPKTIKRWQQVMKNPTGATGKWSTNWVKFLQGFLKERVDHRLEVDGVWGVKSIRALQMYLKAPVDGVISEPKSKTIVAVQRRLNTGKF